MLAISVAESEEEFVKLMNEKALELGCTKSEFYNATGHCNAGNYSSAKDMCLIVEAALENDIVGGILSEKTYDLATTNVHDSAPMTSINRLMVGGSFKNYEGKNSDAVERKCGSP